MLDELHQQFITAVKKGRGSRLAQQESLYSGLVWSGEESVKLGLVDGLGSAGYVARELVGTEEIVNFTKKRDWIDRFTDRIGTTLTGKIEARLLQPSFR
jgi:protease-4